MDEKQRAIFASIIDDRFSLNQLVLIEELFRVYENERELRIAFIDNQIDKFQQLQNKRKEN